MDDIRDYLNEYGKHELKDKTIKYVELSISNRIVNVIVIGETEEDCHVITNQRTTLKIQNNYGSKNK
jgi:hypothetical protein